MTEPSKQYRKPNPGPTAAELREMSARLKPSPWKSPGMIATLIVGGLIAIGVPYFALRTIPGSGNLISLRESAQGDPNATLNLTEFDPLPPDLKEGARAIYGADAAAEPEVLSELDMPSSSELIYPVTEAVDAQRPALRWNAFARAPYSVVVKNKANDVVAEMGGIQGTSWLTSVLLDRGATYQWEVTSADKQTESASFVVLSNAAFAQWQMQRAPLSNAHLALGTVAEQLGLLTVAENEYREAIKAYPQAEAPVRMLNNVLALRDPSVKEDQSTPLLP
ncbi:MAG: hypothetical protein ABI824_00525 [Acidobacteriota bacterium]